MEMMQTHPIPPTLIATITYCLSETGRERSVKAGGAGAYHQNVSGPIAPEDVRLFEVTHEGHISAVFNVMEFDEPQPFSALLTRLRERHRRLTAIRVLMEAEALAHAAFSRSDTDFPGR
jgi:hypothetical protein